MDEVNGPVKASPPRRVPGGLDHLCDRGSSGGSGRFRIEQIVEPGKIEQHIFM